MVWRGRKTSVFIAVAYVIIVASMSLLGFYSLHLSRETSQATRQSLRTSTGALADKIVRKVEKRIIDQDRAIFDLVDLHNLDDFKVFWGRLTTMSSLVEGALVLDAKFRILHYASKEGPRERKLFTEQFSRHILPVLGLHELAPGHHRHLHAPIGGRDYLISYMFMEQQGGRFLVALKINMDYVMRHMLTDELRPLERRYFAAVTDQRGRIVYGRRPPQGLASQRVRRRFPTTLYRFRVELTPRAAASLAAHAVQRERISVGLLVGSLVVTIMGLGLLLWLVHRERAVSELKSEFVSTVSHELKTPLSLIRMYAELMTLDRPGAVERREEYAAVLTRETDRMSRLIENVLDLSRLERGLLPATRPERRDLVLVVRDAVDLHLRGPHSDRARLELVVPDGPVFAEVDEEAVRLALLNLLDNAVKYGGTTVEVTVSAASDGATKVRGRGVWAILVRDDGPGIPAEERKQLFERFFRGRMAVQGRERGSGIGLSLVQLVAEAHGGKISVAEPDDGGKGTVFRLTLPRAEPPKKDRKNSRKKKKSPSQ
jgi:two-component system, OmpR family, phosphate regulon sensor histidine kinase PhoR